jgi:DtxR family Mn-dependent transcriptional regulator
MQFSEQAEEVLESLWLAHEEKQEKCLKLSWLKVMPDTHILKELLGDKIVERCGSEEIKLTEKGMRYASDAIRRHRLAERLLTDVLAVKKELIHETACQFEHHLHRGIDANVCTLLGHPKTCPHGKAIPPGRCCEEKMKVVTQAVSPLAALKPGQKGHIAYLSTTDPKRAQMLLSMGLVPGAPLELLASFPSLFFQLGHGQFAVDRNIAGDIYVRLEN